MSNMTMKNSALNDHLMARVLIIDDDQDMLEAIASALSLNEQFIVKTATDATAAIKLLDEFQPNYALIDVNLSLSNGLDLIPVFKARLPEIQCIVMTAHRKVEYAVSALRCGADEYLLKPVDTDNLVDLLTAINDEALNNIKYSHTGKILIEESSELVFLLDSEGVLVDATKNTLVFSKVDKSKVIGTALYKTPWWEHSHKLQNDVKDAVTRAIDGYSSNLEAEMLDSNSNCLWYEFRVRSLADKDGEKNMVIVDGHDITKHKTEEFKLTLMALSDPLTGLSNRVSLERQLSQVISHASRNESNFALMFIDIDNFKKYNDAYGHQSGDELLVKISEHIKHCAREEDIVARIGGDEFVVVIASAKSRSDALTMAKRINDMFSRLRHRMNSEIAISASIGLAFYPQNGSDVKALLDNADKAMYEAKRKGKNKYVLSSHSNNGRRNQKMIQKEKNINKNKNIYKNNRKVRILIVDDDNDILSSLKDLLQIVNDDYEIDVAQNVTKAKKIFSHFKPDIALLDIKLGQDNGLDLIPELKKKNENLVCIMMTAHRNADYAVTAVRFGANDYLYKPIEPRRLIETIERAVEHINLKRDREESDRRFEAIFEQTFQWIILLDSRGNITETNEESLRFTQFECEDIIGLSLWDAPWWGNSTSLQKRVMKLTKFAQNGEFVREEIGIKNIDGENVTLDVSMKPINSINNELIQIIIECRDVTERKNTENSLMEARDNLEKRVLERTAELEESKKSAEEASEAKSELLSRMSHEFRTPLNAVLGFSQLLRMENVNFLDEQKEAVDNIISGGEYLLRLVNEVLEITDAGSGKLDLLITNIPINSSMKNVIALARPLADQNQITIYEYDADEFIVLADLHRLNQVLLILIENAIKYNQSGGSIDITVDEINEGYIRVSVIDRGIGIQPEDQCRLFEPFAKVGGSSSQTQGTGIGLAIAKILVELMGGNMGCVSEFGSGSTFWFELPKEIT